MAAGKRLFSRKGFHGTNSKEIAGAAGVSVGSFYTYFPDKKLLYLELVRRYNEQMTERIFDPQKIKAFEEKDGRETVQLMLNEVLAFHDIDPAFYQQMVMMRYSDPDVSAIVDEGIELMVKMLVFVLESRRDQLRVTDFEVAARIIVGAIENVVKNIWLCGQDRIEKARLIRELVDMIYSYLFINTKKLHQSK
jgi:AcrR family transcriptional regulator